MTVKILSGFPVDYNVKDVYMISNSQAKSIENCNRYFYINYLQKKQGEEVDYLPFKFGTYAHEILENVMALDPEDRVSAIQMQTESLGEKQPKSFVERAGAMYPRIEELSSKYTNPVLPAGSWAVKNAVDNKEELTAMEMEVALSAPKKWFSKKRWEKFETNVDKMFFDLDLDYKFDNLGIRGIIDYYGVDEDGKHWIVDWKTGRWNKYWGAGYIQQLKIYGYLMHINGFQVDGARLEYIERFHVPGKKVKLDPDRTIEVDIDFKESERIVYNITQKVLDQFQKKFDPQKFPKAKELSECKSCKFSIPCRIPEDHIASSFYKSTHFPLELYR